MISKRLAKMIGSSTGMLAMLVVTTMANAAPPQTANTVGTAMSKATPPTYTQPNSAYANNAGYANSSGTANTATTATSANYANSAGSAQTASTAGSAGSCTGTATQCGVPQTLQNAASVYSLVFVLSGGANNVGSTWWSNCSPGCGQWMTSANPGSWDDNKGDWSQEWTFTTNVAMTECTVAPAISAPQWTNASIYRVNTYTWKILEYWTGNSSGYYNAPIQVACAD